MAIFGDSTRAYSIGILLKVEGILDELPYLDQMACLKVASKQLI